jgi:hypothetical protein
MIMNRVDCFCKFGGFSFRNDRKSNMESKRSWREEAPTTVSITYRLVGDTLF